MEGGFDNEYVNQDSIPHIWDIEHENSYGNAKRKDEAVTPISGLVKSSFMSPSMPACVSPNKDINITGSKSETVANNNEELMFASYKDAIGPIEPDPLDIAHAEILEHKRKLERLDKRLIALKGWKWDDVVNIPSGSSTEDVGQDEDDDDDADSLESFVKSKIPRVDLKSRNRVAPVRLF